MYRTAKEGAFAGPSEYAARAKLIGSTIYMGS
jgi:hypothetical protein